MRTNLGAGVPMVRPVTSALTRPSIVAGDRSVTDEVEDKVFDALGREIERRQDDDEADGNPRPHPGGEREVR